MSTKRSYLDNLNAGRRRRSAPESSFEQISRTLEQLEGRLDRAREPQDAMGEQDEISRRIERLSARVSEPRTEPARAARQPLARSQSSLSQMANRMEKMRREQDEVSTVGGIAEELKALRAELQDLMRAGLTQEFETLRQELADIMSTVPASHATRELVREFEHLSGAIGKLAERSDDQQIALLRHDIEEVKNALAAVAREETLEASQQRWNAFEDRVSADLQRQDPAIDALHKRLEEIAHAVDDLPESLSLRSLEERVRTLAVALDELLNQKAGGPEIYAMIEERLDEISRAIANSVAKSHVTTGFDPKSFERIEARIASLASQMNELANDRSGTEAVGQLHSQISALALRVDDIAQRVEIPEQAMGRLAEQLNGISLALDAAPRTTSTEAIIEGLEQRFADLSATIERRQGDAIEQGRSLFGELEERIHTVARQIGESAVPRDDQSIMSAIDERFNALAAQLEDRLATPADTTALGALESRLEDISQRLQDTTAQVSSVDPELIRNLEAQVKGLSEHLARPGRDLPEFEDISPRLATIEESIRENRGAVLEAARQAAEQAVRNLGVREDKHQADELRAELKALETLTRKSDERNAKTFEAVHDTLLKIVERLGTVEQGGPSVTKEAGKKIAVQHAPSIDSSVGDEAVSEEMAEDAASQRSPAEAAAAAARAALSEDNTDEMTPDSKRSLFGGISRAIAGRKATLPDRVDLSERAEPALPQTDDHEAELDAPHLDRPLEPGSGAPDLNAILRRVRDDNGPATARDSGHDVAKSDFIAAARRAAQAAAAEAEILKNRQTGSTETRGRFGLGGLFKRSGKTLVVVLGAGVVLAGGYQLGKAYLLQSTALQPVVQAPLPENDDRMLTTAAVDAPSMDIPDPADQRPVRILDEEKEIDETAETLAAIPSAPVKLQPETGPQLARNTSAPDNNTDAAREVMPETIALSVPDAIGPKPLREAAADGDPLAHFYIGDLYAQGSGTERKLDEAERWYRRAAEAGLAPAQYRLGEMYQKGNGVERDIAEAKMWFQLAAEQGNAPAMHNLGVLYAMGADGPVDNQSAARWFQAAADRGITDSQFNLGILAAKGLGLEQDLIEAYKWFDLVARTGDKDAEAKRDEIASMLGEERLKIAKDTAKLWKPKTLERDVNAPEIPDSWRIGTETTASIDMKKAISNIQLILNKEGFEAGPADGVMGDKTRSAIISFQKANGMTANGEITEELVKALLERNRNTASED